MRDFIFVLDINNGICLQYLYRTCDMGDRWYTVDFPISFVGHYVVSAGPRTLGVHGASTAVTIQSASTNSHLIVGLSGCDASWGMYMICMGY